MWDGKRYKNIGIFLFASLTCLFILTISSTCHTAEIKVLAVSPDLEKVELGPYIQLLEDTSKTLAILDVSTPQFSNKFSDNQAASISRGITDSAYWFRFSLIRANNNQSYNKIGHKPHDTELLLSLGRRTDYFDVINVFWKQSGEKNGAPSNDWQMATFGKNQAVKNGKRDPPCIKITLPQDTNQSVTFYIQIEIKSGFFFTPVLYSTYSYINFSKKLSIFYGVYYGLLLSMLIYNLFHYLFLREKVRLIFIMYATTLGVYFFIVNELSMAIIPTYYLHAIRKTAQFLLLVTFAQSFYFTIVFLNAKRTVPLIYRLLQAITLISCALILALPFVSYISMLKVITDFSKFTTLIIMLAGFVAWFKGYHPARFFLLAWFFYLGGGLIYALNFQGTFPYTFIGNNAYQAGSGIEMLLLSLAIADRLKFLFKRLNNAQEKRQKQLNTLTQQLIQTEERERRRIAGVLHDSIGQTLCATKWEVQQLLKACNSSDADASMALPYLDTCINETRSLTSELYPQVLYELGLEAGLQSLAEDFAKRSDLVITVNSEKNHQVISEELKLILYRTVSELLNNVVKHANANHAEVSLIIEDDTISVSVQDDGTGFDYLNEQSTDITGFGLFSIQERLHSIGGTLNVAIVTSGGSKVTISAPVLVEEELANHV